MKKFKKMIVRMYQEDGRAIKSLSEENHVSKNGSRYIAPDRD